MHRRLLMASSALICSVAVFLAWVLCDLHDRSLPQELHPTAVVSVAAPDGMDDAEVFRQLEERNAALNLGLVKIVPDMERGTDAQVFVPLPGTQLDGLESGSSIRRFGSLPDGSVAGMERLDSASANGQYLVCGRWDGITRSAFEAWAAGTGARLEYGSDGMEGDLRMLLGQSAFRVAIGATVALMAVLALFWLSFKARSRALRVLAGVPGWKIQFDDAMGLMSPMLAVAAAADAVAVLAVLALRGAVFVPYLLRVMLLFEAMVFGSLLAFVIAVAALCWPSARMIASRRPMPRGLLRASVLVKAMALIAVLAVIAPSAAAFGEASASAREQSVWRRLRDQVSVSTAFGPDQTDMDTKAAELVRTMEERGDAALSYAFVDGQDADAVTGIVTRSWLDLIGIDPDATDGIRPIANAELPEQAAETIGQFAAWTRNDAAARNLTAESRCYAADGVAVPMLKGGSDEMLFPKRATLIVVPDMADFSDSGFLVPALSSRNIVLTGLNATRAQVGRLGLSGKVSVRYVAEDQILRAQFAAYFAWMRAASIILLLAAFAMVAFVGTDVRATLRADHDYPLLLNGYAPLRLAAPTILAETLFGTVAAALVCGVLVLRHSGGDVAAPLAGAAPLGSATSLVCATLFAAASAMTFSACCHRAAVAGRFRSITERTM